MSEMRRMLDPLKRSISNRVQRAVVNLVNDALKMQRVQVGILAGEVKDSVERFQNFGFTGHPVPGAEAVILRLGGGSDHAVIIAVDDRRFRKTDLVEGESAVYDAFGKFIHLTKDGGIIIDAAGADVTVNNAATVAINASAGVVITTPTLTVHGATVFDGTVTANGKRIDETHTHSGVQPGAGNSGAVV
ncbi:MAG: phage baseplate assembly protein V [Parvibaculum sp.]|nr:phage baseplate assembly protein V [Parvibaculum sp.]